MLQLATAPVRFLILASRWASRHLNKTGAVVGGGRGNAMLFAAVVANAAQAQMSIPGQFAVSVNGDATYSIRVAVPPGISGLEPRLSLSYSSQSGSGLAGIGWSINGLSAITRCSQSRAHDGDGWIGGVSFTSTDRYCLDGQRLFAIGDPAVPGSAPGAYGVSGTYYATEQEGFSKIQSFGSVGTGTAPDGQPHFGPAYFVVKTKDGLTMEYGNSSTSRAPAAFLDSGKSAVRMWALNKVSDVKGNYMAITYTVPNPVTGQTYPLRVDYTANDIASPSVAASSSVVFEYETRPDNAAGYQAGTRVGLSLRAKSIKTYANGVLVKDYRLSYTTSKLSSIAECSGAGACLPATTFTYQPYATSMTSTTHVVANAWGSDPYTWIADFNGDGLDDIASASGSSIYVKRSNGSGFVDETWTTVPSWGAVGYNWVADIDLDGLPDIVSAHGGNVYVKRFTSTGVVNQSYAVPALWGSAEFTWVADFNGDGRLDIASAYGGTIHLHSFTGSAFSYSSHAVANNWGSGGYTWVADFNGDGLPDIASAYGGNVNMKINTKNGFADRVWPVADVWGAADFTWVGDFNGDGLADIASAAGGAVHMKLSTGIGFVSQTWAVPDNWGGSSFTWVADFNGDGLPDIGTAAAGTLYVKLGTGMGFVQQSWSVANSWGGTGFNRIADVNGDGMPDIVSPYSGTILVKSPVGGRSAATQFTDGLGGVVTPTYSTLPRALLDGRYAVDNTLTVPGLRNAIVPAMQVVTDVAASNGVGSTRRTSYWYGTAVAEVSASGRGLMGFKWQRARDVSTGIETQTNFRQDFPYAGMIESATTISAGGQVLSTTSNSYGCFDPAAGPASTCTVGPQKRYFVHSLESTTRAWGLAGAALPGSRVRSQDLDAYGNVGTVITTTLNPDGTPSEHSKTAISTYYNNPASWHLGRVLRTSVTATSPDVAPPVVPGSVPPAPASATLKAPVFPATQVGSSNTAVATLDNQGGGAISVTPPGAASVTGTDFSFVATTCSSSLAAGASCSATVRFSPTSTTPRSGSLSTVTAAGTKTVSLNATGVSGSATLTNPSFPVTQVGQSSTATATLTNTGIAAISVTPPSSGSVSGADFSFVSTTCGSSLAVGASCTTTVRFSPTSTAARTGSLSIATGAGTKTASLSAAGQGSVAVLTSGPPNFGNVWYGQSAPTATASLRNDGNTSMTLTGLGGLSSRFQVTANNCTNVVPGASCSMTMTMPTNVAGGGSDYATTVGASVNATFSVTGEVYSAVSRWSTTSLSFGNVEVGFSGTQNLTLYNDGYGASINWSGALANLPAGFSANTSACNSVPPGGGSCNVAITFTPAAGQGYGGSGIMPIDLSYANNSLSVSGTGFVVPPVASFSPVPGTTLTASSAKYCYEVRTYNDASIAVTNTGRGTLSISASSSSPYLGLSYTCTSAGAGQSCSVGIRRNATTSGATVTVTTNAGNATYAVGGTYFTQSNCGIPK